MSTRGFAAIALHNPKSPHNVGGVMRAAGCYGADLIVVGGKRRTNTIRHIPTDVQNTWKQIPTLEVEDIFDAMPVGAIPIAVDLLPAATPLPEYKHPAAAFYIFGAEDSTLGKQIVSRCRDIVSVPTEFCMNLAACVNVVLYDRMAKAYQRRVSLAA